MKLSRREKTIHDLRREVFWRNWIILSLSVLSLVATIAATSRTEILVMQTPGMPENSVIAKSTFDKGAQMATLFAVTSAIAGITPGTVEYQKKFLSYYLQPSAYTRVIKEIDQEVLRMSKERELGSRYFVLGGSSQRQYEYDEKLDKHFVFGDVHIVNAAKDSSDPYVFEFKINIENYRLWVVDVASYPGDKPHNSAWLEATKGGKP